MTPNRLCPEGWRACGLGHVPTVPIKWWVLPSWKTNTQIAGLSMMTKFLSDSCKVGLRGGRPDLCGCLIMEGTSRGEKQFDWERHLGDKTRITKKVPK